MNKEMIDNPSETEDTEMTKEPSNKETNNKDKDMREAMSNNPGQDKTHREEEGMTQGYVDGLVVENLNNDNNGIEWVNQKEDKGGGTNAKVLSDVATGKGMNLQ